MYEDIAAQYEAIAPTQWLVLTAPIIAFALYHVMKLSPHGRNINRYASLALGVCYCLFVSLSHYPSVADALKQTVILSVLFFMITVVMEAGKLHAARQYVGGATSAFARKIGGILERYPEVSAMVLIAVFLWPGTFHGLDVTDSGYHLSQSALVFHNGLAKAGDANIAFLSFYFSGALLAALDWLGFGMFGARLLWVLSLGVTVGIVIHVLKRLFFSHWLLPVFALTAVANQTVYTKVLDYESVPSLLAAMLVYTGYRVFSNPIGKPSVTMNVLFALSFVVLIFSRLSVATLGVICLLPMVVAYFQPTYRATIVKSLTIQSVTAITAVGLFIAALHYYGSLGDYFTFESRTDLHSMNGFLTILASQIYGFFAQQMAVTIVFMLLMFAGAFYLSSAWLFALVVATLAVLAAPLIYTADPASRYSMPIAIGSVILFLALCKHWENIAASKRLYVLMLASAALLMPWVLSFGSYSALTKLVNGSWLLLPVALFSVLLIAKQSSSLIAQRNLFMICVVLTVLLLMSGFRTFHRNPYNDHYDRRAMSASFEYPSMRGIHTMPGRKDSFEALLRAVDDLRPLAHDRLFAYNNIPMLFYATKTHPLFDEPWPNAMSRAFVGNIADAICSSKQTTPALIVRTKVETRSGNWGNNPDVRPFMEDIIHTKSKLATLDNAIKRCDSQLVWENHDFQIWKPKRIN